MHQGAQAAQSLMKIFQFPPAVAAVAAAGCLAWPSALLAQAVAPVLPDSMIAGKGETKSNSLTSGSRSSLTLGINSNMGTNASISAQSGYTATADSGLAITSGGFSSSFGKTGIVEADIRNIRSEGVQSGSVAGSDYTIVPTSANTAQGQATVKGMASEAAINLDPGTYARAQAGQKTGTTVAAGTSNASAGHSMATSMNVDISNTGFSQAFSQAF